MPKVEAGKVPNQDSSATAMLADEFREVPIREKLSRIRRNDERLLVLSNEVADVDALVATAEEVGIALERCHSVEALCVEIETGAGLAVISQETLPAERAARLARTLRHQPAWSDFLLILLAAPPTGGETGAHPETDLGLGSVIVLERPLARRTLRSVLRSSLLRRRSQYEFARSQAMLASAHLGHWTWDLRQNHVSWSEEMYRIFGVHPETFVPSQPAVRERIHPEDRDRHDNRVRTALAGDTAGSFECRILRPDGEERIVEASGFEVEADLTGTPLRLFGTVLDVTERRRAEQQVTAKNRQLADLTTRLNQMIELSPCMLGHYDREFRPIDISPACRSILGYEPTEMMEVSLDRWVHQEDRSHVYATLRELVEGGPAVQVRHRARSKDGALVWLDTYARREQGELHTASLNVTIRVQAQQALQAERDFLTTLFETMSQGVTYQNAQGAVERANPAAERILGLSLQQLQGRTSIDPRWRSIREDGTPVAGDDHPSMTAIRTGKTLADVRMGVFNPAEGKTRWLSINAIPRMEPGHTKPSGAYAIFTDITRLREANLALERNEKILRMALDASKSGLWYWDMEANTGFTNLNYPQLLGLQPADMERWEEKLFDYIHPEDQILVRRELLKCVKREQSSFTLLHRMLHASGRVIWVSASGIIVDEESPGNARRLAGTIRDVTELVEARYLAEQYAARRRDFLANMSHEIRTPMNGIIGLAAILAETDLAVEQRHLLHHMQACGDSLLTLVNDILDLSKIEAGKLLLECVAFEPAALVEEALNVVRSNARAKGLDLQFVVDESVPLFVSGDANRLRQVLVNLLSNAVKFTDHGRVALSVRGQVSEGVVTLSVEVSDTGIGITPDQQARIFGAFEQAERSTTRLFGGTGLGLAISKMLVELMGGTIHAESQLGEGSRFFFTARMTPVPEIPASDPAPAAMTVLLVSADDSERSLRTRQLESLGIHVQTGRECPCDVVLLAPDSFQQAAEWIVDLRLRESLCSKPCLVVVPSELNLEHEPRDSRLSRVKWLPRPLRCGALRKAISRAGAPHSGEPQERVRARLKNKRVLIAEDNAVNQLVTGKMLERLGCLASFAKNGREAVDQLQSGAPFDIVLMDCQMPDVDGLEATRMIRSMPGNARTVPIVALSAGVLAEDREACFECGMDAFLSKPVSLEELCRVLDPLLPAKR